MRRIICCTFFFLVVIVLFATTKQVFAKADGNYYDTFTIAQALNNNQGGAILSTYPLNGEQLINRQPRIGINLPTNIQEQLSIPNIKVFVDGIDVTSEAQVTLGYVVYFPKIPLNLGIHYITVEHRSNCSVLPYDGQCVCRNDNECLSNDCEKKEFFGDSLCFGGSKNGEICKDDNDCPDAGKCEIAGKCAGDFPTFAERWQFTIIPPVPTPAPTKQVTAGKQKTEPVKGKFVLENTNVFLSSASPLAYTTLGNIRYKEVSQTTNNIDIKQKRPKGTLLGHIDRSIEEITGRPNDKGYIQYISQKNDLTFGDFYLYSRDFSDFTIANVQVRGVKSLKKYGKTSWLNFYGRTQEPQDGRFKRFSVGTKFASNYSKTAQFSLMLLAANQDGKTTTAPIEPTAQKNTIGSVKTAYKFTKAFSVESELAFSNYDDDKSPYAKNPAGRVPDQGYDSAAKFVATYDYKPLTFQAQYRNIGPLFTPILLGSYADKDKKGFIYSLTYRPNSKIDVSSTYDNYKDNLHNNFVAYPYRKNETKNSSSSLSYRPENLPSLSFRYTKTYQESENKIVFGAIKQSESTNASTNISYNLPDTNVFSGNTVSFSNTRYDLDKAITGSTVMAVRNNTLNYSFASRYKAFAQLSYNTSTNKSSTLTKVPAKIGFTETFSYSTSKTNSLGLQLNIIPYKFITNFNYRRSTTLSTNATGAMTANPKDTTFTSIFTYYISKITKLNFEYTNYDKQFREAVNRAKSYNEELFKLTFTEEF